MTNFLDIARAWIKASNPDPADEIIANNRIEICNTCPSKTYWSVFDVWVCGECNCPLSKKIYSESKENCPLNRWKI